MDSYQILVLLLYHLGDMRLGRKLRLVEVHFKYLHQSKVKW